jgi:hypothetical protein
MSGGGGGGGQNTVQTSQQIPQFEQDFAQSNQDLARSIGSQPYPTYGAPLIQGQDPWQNAGQAMAVNAAGNYQPGLNQAEASTGAAMDPSGVNAYSGAAYGAVGRALGQSPTNTNDVAAYMSPYIQQSLAPQIQNLQLQQAQQQQQIDAHATQANAFGDARQGASEALQNYYGNQVMTGLVSGAYNNAYGQALQAMQGQQGIDLNSAAQLGSLGNQQLQEQGVGLQGANQLANIAGLNQQLGITGANAVYNVGQQNQQLGQSQLNAAYQQYLNQVNWPTQMLNIRESALSNSPYNIASAVTLPQANSVAQGFGGVGSAAGMIGSLLSGSGGGSGNSPFGGQRMQ